MGDRRDTCRPRRFLPTYVAAANSQLVAGRPWTETPAASSRTDFLAGLCGTAVADLPAVLEGVDLDVVPVMLDASADAADTELAAGEALRTPASTHVPVVKCA